jgi:hypothetical protein
MQHQVLVRGDVLVADFLPDFALVGGWRLLLLRGGVRLGIRRGVVILDFGGGADVFVADLQAGLPTPRAGSGSSRQIAQANTAPGTARIQKAYRQDNTAATSPDTRNPSPAPSSSPVRMNP